MDMIAYWTYAVLQSVIAVTLLDIRSSKLLRNVALVFFAWLAPLVSVGFLYIGMDRALIWLQQPGVKK